MKPSNLASSDVRVPNLRVLVVEKLSLVPVLEIGPNFSFTSLMEIGVSPIAAISSTV